MDGLDFLLHLVGIHYNIILIPVCPHQLPKTNMMVLGPYILWFPWLYVPVYWIINVTFHKL